MGLLTVTERVEIVVTGVTPHSNIDDILTYLRMRLELKYPDELGHPLGPSVEWAAPIYAELRKRNGRWRVRRAEELPVADGPADSRLVVLHFVRWRAR